MPLETIQSGRITVAEWSKATVCSLKSQCLQSSPEAEKILILQRGMTVFHFLAVCCRLRVYVDIPVTPGKRICKFHIAKDVYASYASVIARMNESVR